MFLKRLALTNIRSIEHLELSCDTGEDRVRKWTLVLGENGNGKSTLLRAAAFVTAGSNALPEPLVRPKTWIRQGAETCVMPTETTSG